MSSPRNPTFAQRKLVNQTNSTQNQLNRTVIANKNNTKNNFNFSNRALAIPSLNGAQNVGANQILSLSATHSPLKLKNFHFNVKETTQQTSKDFKPNQFLSKFNQINKSLITSQSDAQLRKKYPKIVDQQTLQKVSSLLKGDNLKSEENTVDLEFKIIQHKAISQPTSPKNVQNDMVKISDRGLVLSSKLRHKRKQINPLPLMKHTSTKGLSDEDKESVEHLNE